MRLADLREREKELAQTSTRILRVQEVSREGGEVEFEPLPAPDVFIAGNHQDLWFEVKNGGFAYPVAVSVEIPGQVDGQIFGHRRVLVPPEKTYRFGPYPKLHYTNYLHIEFDVEDGDLQDVQLAVCKLKRNL